MWSNPFLDFNNFTDRLTYQKSAHSSRWKFVVANFSEPLSFRRDKVGVSRWRYSKRLGSTGYYRRKGDTIWIKNGKCSFPVKLSILRGFASGWLNLNPIFFCASVSKRTQKRVAVFRVLPVASQEFQTPFCDLFLSLSSTYLTRTRNLWFELTRTWGSDALNWWRRRLEYSPFSLFNVGHKITRY